METVILDLPARAWKDRLPDLHERLTALIRQAEKGALARRLDPAWVLEVLEATMAAHPDAGVLKLDGGAVTYSYRYPAWTTRVIAAWYRRGPVLRLRLDAWRGGAPHVAWGRGPDGTLRAPGDAWLRCYPERVARFRQLLAARTAARLRRWGLAVPPTEPQPHAASLGEVLRVFPQARGVLAARRGATGTRQPGAFLTCPGGWWEIRRTVTARAVSSALGIPEAVARRLLRGRLSWTELLGELAATQMGGI
jgi:hypothetical protein